MLGVCKRQIISDRVLQTTVHIFFHWVSNRIETLGFIMLNACLTGKGMKQIAWFIQWQGQSPSLIGWLRAIYCSKNPPSHCKKK